MRIVQNQLSKASWLKQCMVDQSFLIYLGHFKIKRHILSQLCSSVYFNKHKNLLLQMSFPKHIGTNFLDFYFSWKKKDQMMSFLSIFMT